MQFSLDQMLIFCREVGGRMETEHVFVTGLRKRGGAKLSNGWTVDEDGYADGTSRIPGGFVMEFKEPAKAAA
jgi:hypothetical protein